MVPEPIDVLLVEDNVADARLIEIMLRESSLQQYKLTSVQTFKEAMEFLTNNHTDVLLLDLSLPDSFGLETVQNANAMAQQVPIIVLTGRNDEDFAVEVVKAGAQDYLIKGQIEQTLLSRAIRYAMQRKQMEVDLKRINRQIEESEDRLNTIVTNNISGITVLSKNNQIKFVNPAAEKMLDAPAADLLGKEFEYTYSLTAPTLVKLKKEDLLAELLAVETVWGGEPSTLITMHDITELKRAEESLRVKNIELTRINKALDRLVYMVSHDLKKPTANIIGLLSLYDNEMKGQGSDKAKAIVDKLSFSATQLKKMIEELLEQARVPLEEKNYELIDFKRLYSEIETSLEQAILEANAQITTDFSRYPLIYYHYQDLRSILSNLLSNSIKYRAADRRPEISIKTEKNPSGPVLIVKDNGIGMDLEANKEQLFKRYQRFSDQAEGTGLGLWLVKDTVERHGGRIEVESTPDVGTTFRIIF